MASQVGDNREVASTALDLAGEWLLAGMAVHVRLQRAWSRESLVADLALVLLLSAGRDLGAELAHHGLRRGRHRGHHSLRPRKRSRADGFNV